MRKEKLMDGQKSNACTLISFAVINILSRYKLQPPHTEAWPLPEKIKMAIIKAQEDYLEKYQQMLNDNANKPMEEQDLELGFGVKEDVAWDKCFKDTLVKPEEGLTSIEDVIENLDNSEGLTANNDAHTISWTKNNGGFYKYDSLYGTVYFTTDKNEVLKDIKKHAELNGDQISLHCTKAKKESLSTRLQDAFEDEVEDRELLATPTYKDQYNNGINESQTIKERDNKIQNIESLSDGEIHDLINEIQQDIDENEMKGDKCSNDLRVKLDGQLASLYQELGDRGDYSWDTTPSFR